MVVFHESADVGLVVQLPQVFLYPCVVWLFVQINREQAESSVGSVFEVADESDVFVIDGGGPVRLEYLLGHYQIPQKGVVRDKAKCKNRKAESKKPAAQCNRVIEIVSINFSLVVEYYIAQMNTNSTNN